MPSAYRRALWSGRGGTWLPILLAIYGAGLIGAGVFSADAGAGFPPGTPLESPGISRSGLLHFVFGGIGFYALIAACFVAASRFGRQGRRGWASYSIFTGIAFFVAFAAIASGNVSAVVMLSFYAAVAWVWAWHTALMIALCHDLR